MSQIPVTSKTMELVLARAMATGADYAELYLEHTGLKNISLMDGKVYSIGDQVISGASVRIYKGLRSVFASTSDISEKGLLSCAERTAGALGEGSAPIHIHLRERIFGDIHPIRIVPTSVSIRTKLTCCAKPAGPRRPIMRAFPRSGAMRWRRIILSRSPTATAC